MKTLIKKEIRLLLPAWLAAMLLAIVPPPIFIWTGWLTKAPDIGVPLGFIVGFILLGIQSFGHEINSGTFTTLLAQPMERRRIWRIKMSVLALAFISVLFVWAVPKEIYFVDRLYASATPNPDFPFEIEKNLILSVVTIFSGALWTTLLLRQVLAAFWLTLLVPLAIVYVIGLVSGIFNCTNEVTDTLTIGASLVYSIAGFLFARRLFLRAEDVQWTGGEVSLPRRERISKISASSLSVRPRHWIYALAWKELQLHQGTFLIAAIVLMLHLTACLFRRFHPHIQNPTLDFVLGNFWIVWLLMPLLIGAAAIAEERRMGTLEPQLCVPVSRSAQLFFKFSLAAVLSLVFGAVMPALIEIGICGASLGDSGVWVIARNDMAPDQWHWVAVLAAAIFFVSFYASSLGRTALQGIGLAIPVALLIYFYEGVTGFDRTWPGIGFYSNPHFGIAILERYLGIPILVFVLGWLIFSNFKHSQQNRRFWIRNIVAILAVFICVPIVARAIYVRPWEIFLPLEPRGPVCITSPTDVKLVTSMDAIYAISSNGLLWFAPFTYNLNHVDSERGQSIGGSNWVDVAVNEFEALAVQSNGTLWSLGGNTGRPSKKQIGDESDWLQVAGGFSSFLILKKDGSLWSWGNHPYNWDGKSNPNPPLNQKLQRDFASPPVRVSNETNWIELFSERPCVYARNKDGNDWLLGDNHMMEETNLDSRWSGLQFNYDGSYLEVKTNGDLLYLDRNRIVMNWGRRRRGLPVLGPEQLGEPWTWKTAAFGHINGWQAIMAVRSDGTLWKFPLRQAPKFIMGQPVQLGTRSDWVAVSEGFSLASDGSIWTWNEHSKYAWLAPSRRPVCVGNIFEGTDHQEP